MFTDTITIFNKTIIDKEVDGLILSDIGWKKTIIEGVQWSNRNEKSAEGGKINVANYATITFPAGTYEHAILNPANEEDAIFLGIIEESVEDKKGHRISDLMNRYPQSGRIKSVNDNSNRSYLKNVKVVIA